MSVSNSITNFNWVIGIVTVPGFFMAGYHAGSPKPALIGDRTDVAIMAVSGLIFFIGLGNAMIQVFV
jgi:hypothetical protein